MHCNLKIFLTLSIVNVSFSSFCQVVQESKTPIDPQISKRIKDTTIYKIILSYKDTIMFGSNRKTMISEGQQSLIGIFERKQNILFIKFTINREEMLSIRADIKKVEKDTIQVFSPDLITTSKFLKVQNTFYCNVSSVQLNNYSSSSNFAYIKRIISRLFKSSL